MKLKHLITLLMACITLPMMGQPDKGKFVTVMDIFLKTGNLIIMLVQTSGMEQYLDLKVRAETGTDS